MTDREKLEGIIAEIDILIEKKVNSSNADFQAWKTKAERFLIKRYGKNSLEHTKFTETHFSLPIFTMNTPDSRFVSACKDGLMTTKAIFLMYLEEMKEEQVPPRPSIIDSTYETVFIVHGHDGELKQSVARLVEKQGLQAIILSEQANKGKTIIEKFEENSDVSGAICLFTADDLGHAKADSKEKARARQNVVFEAGYFMGKLGRNRVVIIAENGVELPSDMQGIVYTDKSSWEVDVLKELKAMGYTIDFNKFF